VVVVAAVGVVVVVVSIKISNRSISYWVNMALQKFDSILYLSSPFKHYRNYTREYFTR